MGQKSSQLERQRLLPPDPEHLNDEVDHDGCFPPHRTRDVCPANPWADLPVYATIHRIRKDIIEAIDDPYSLEQLRDPRMNLSVVRPLVDRFYEMDDVSVSMFFVLFFFGFVGFVRREKCEEKRGGSRRGEVVSLISAANCLVVQLWDAISHCLLEIFVIRKHHE